MKVAISGLGGDELFGGYGSFGDLPRWTRWATIPSRIPLLGRLIRIGAVASGLDRAFISPKAAGMVEYGGTFPGAYLLRRGVFMPWELDQVLDRETVHMGLERLRPLALVASALVPEPGADFGKVAALEASLYMRNQLLRDTDWASMAHGLEVRVPLVDSRLLEAVAPILLQDGEPRGKRALAAASRVPLPEAVLKRIKTGFTTPIASWLQRMPGQRYTSVPMLAAPNCRWARRWAYCIAAKRDLGAGDRGCRVRMLALVTDAFGGAGGIAQYNRDLLTALAAEDAVERRARPPPPGRGDHGSSAWSRAPIAAAPGPYRLQHRSLSRRQGIAPCRRRLLRPPLHGAAGRAPGPAPARAAVGAGARRGCLGHALASGQRWPCGARTSSPVSAASRATSCWTGSIWSPGACACCPTPCGRRSRRGRHRPTLRERYRLGDRRVLLTVSRIGTADRYKGHDRVIAALPALLRAGADVAYLIVGSGDDTPRLAQVAAETGVSDRVILAGAAPADELADHYRLADVFVMPSTKEGFGIVFLEAAACGVPVVGGNRDGSWDALREGYLGRAIDPDDEGQLVDGGARRAGARKGARYGSRSTCSGGRVFLPTLPTSRASCPRRRGADRALRGRRLTTAADLDGAAPPAPCGKLAPAASGAREPLGCRRARRDGRLRARQHPPLHRAGAAVGVRRGQPAHRHAGARHARAAGAHHANADPLPLRLQRQGRGRRLHLARHAPRGRRRGGDHRGRDRGPPPVARRARQRRARHHRLARGLGCRDRPGATC